MINLSYIETLFVSQEKEKVDPHIDKKQLLLKSLKHKYSSNIQFLFLKRKKKKEIKNTKNNYLECISFVWTILSVSPSDFCGTGSTGLPRICPGNARRVVITIQATSILSRGCSRLDCIFVQLHASFSFIWLF